MIVYVISASVLALLFFAFLLTAGASLVVAIRQMFSRHTAPSDRPDNIRPEELPKSSPDGANALVFYSHSYEDLRKFEAGMLTWSDATPTDILVSYPIDVRKEA
jgi:hypothetical protein